VTSVIVGFVHRADSLSPQFRRCLTTVQIREAAIPSLRRIIGELDHESSANVSTARCKIVSEFLAHPAKPEWLWMIDSDMTFPEDILDRLLAAADPRERPIVGGLCFGVRPVQVDGHERMVHHFDYPRDAVIQVNSTGAACLLVHRSVLADPRWVEGGHPLPWFRESVLHGAVCSEDHFFCLRAGSLGFPVHINTSARTGHVKTFVADEDCFLAQRSALSV
jgi:hypothetical protein